MMGKPRPESVLAAQGREVLWLAESEPPVQLVTFLRSRGLALVASHAQSTNSPLKLLQIEAGGPALARTPQLSGRRIAVMHPDPGNADALAQSLRAKGAEVVALSLNPSSLQRAETLDPDAVIMEASDFSGSCWEIVRALWEHPHLRFATIILATPELMGGPHTTALDVQHLSVAITEVAKSYERVREDAQKCDRFAFELHDLGPSRSLRALLESGHSLRALFTCDEATIEIDLAEQIIVGAQSPAGAAPTEGLLGVHALNLLLSQRAAHVEVRRVDHPARTNVMAPLETALHMARDLVSAPRPSGTQVPVAAERTQAAKPNKVSLNRTLIGVPAVQVDPALLGTKTKPGTAPPPVAKPEPKQDAKPEPAPRPSIPARPIVPSIPAPGPTKRSLPPARRKSDEAVESVASFPTQPAPPPARALSLPPALPSAKPPEPVLERAPSAPSSIVVAPDVMIEPVGPAPTPEPLRALSPQSALETLKLRTYTPDADAELVRAFRGGPALKLSGRARWIAGGVCTVLLGGWLFMRGASEKPSAEPIIAPAAAELVPLARAAEPVAPVPVARPPIAPEPSAAAPVQAGVTVAEDEELPPSAREGRQTRESARRAGLLCNQGNDFKNKKMLPTARVRYLEALRLYPDYPRALAGLTQLALGAGDSREALKYAKQLVKARPGQAPYQLLLGDAYRAAHDEKAAREAYQTAQRFGSRAAQERLGK